MADGTVLITSNEVVIEQYEARPEIYIPVSEADLKTDARPRRAKTESDTPVEEPVESEPEAKTEGK